MIMVYCKTIHIHNAILTLLLFYQCLFVPFLPGILTQVAETGANLGSPMRTCMSSFVAQTTASAMKLNKPQFVFLYSIYDNRFAISFSNYW